ncbi:MAG: hypothetical protein ABIH66_00820 [bacterium]
MSGALYVLFLDADCADKGGLKRIFFYNAVSGAAKDVLSAKIIFYPRNLRLKKTNTWGSNNGDEKDEKKGRTAPTRERGSYPVG